MRGTASTRLAAATSAVTNRFVASTDMKVGAYTLANGGAMPAAGARRITVAVTAAQDPDTMGTIDVAGVDLSGQPIVESIVPIAGTPVTGTLWFARVTSVTGVGWVINEGTPDADAIIVGCTGPAIVAQGGGVLHAVVVNTTAAGAVTIADSTGTLAVLKASIAEGTYVYDIPFSGYLSIALAGASDVTIVHTPTIPSSYAMA